MILHIESKKMILGQISLSTFQKGTNLSISSLLGSQIDESQ